MGRSDIVLLLTGTAIVGVVVWILVVPPESGAMIATVVGSLAGVGALGASVWAVLRPQASGRDSASRPPCTDEFVSQLAELSADAVLGQLTVLTNRGQMTVPWKIVDSPSRSSGPVDRFGIPALADVLENAGLRMEIIGRSDSGKTTALYLLADFLLNGQDDPAVVPFPVSVASWVPTRQSLLDWMASQTLRTFPQLEERHTHSELVAVLGSGRIAPFLDGFDEITPACQEDARDALRLASTKLPLVVTSRPLGGDLGHLRLLERGALVQLEPVGIDEVARYLAAGSHGDKPWQDAVRALRHLAGPELVTTLSSPLMAWLACTVYAPRLRDRRDLGELAAGGLTERAAIEEHLLTALVPEAFRRDSLRPDGRLDSRGHYRQAHLWLSFLATKLGPGRRISFWTLSRLAPMYRIGLVLAAVAGTLLGLLVAVFPRLALGLVVAHVLGLFFGLAFVRAYARSRILRPGDPNRTGFGGRVLGTDGDWYLHSGRFAFGSFLTVVMCGLVVVVSGGSALQLVDSRFLVLVGAVVVLTSITAWVGGSFAAAVLRAAPRLDSLTGARARNPVEVVANDRRSGVGMAVLAWAFNGVVVAAVLQVGVGGGLLVGLVAGAGAVPSAVSLFNAWVNYKVAHLWLVLRNRLPWRVVDFLHEAHLNGVLRQNGITYEFRHDRLREALVRSGR